VLSEVEARGWADGLEAAGVTVVTDTCTYITPILERTDGVVMTNSAKWAYYAPGNLGVEVCFGSLRECVESAFRGHVWRDPDGW
jgi:predicted aconitase